MTTLSSTPSTTAAHRVSEPDALAALFPRSAAASAHTRALHQQALSELPFDDTRDLERAQRGWLGTRASTQIRNADGQVVWDLNPYDFLDSETAPETVHPSLWRQARLNRLHGLFQVVDRIYQVRGFDIANVTIIEGETGLIVIDPLTTVESARAALELYFEHRPRRPIHTVIYTHSHADHFGGVRGIIDEQQLHRGEVALLAPAGFVEETVSENVLAGPAMARRSLYQFGQRLPIGPTGTVDAGLGKASTGGTITLLAPTRLIVEETETHLIDGVEIVFQLTPETEAPAELHLYFPQWKAFNAAENATHTQHNLLPLRGAKVRDAKAWAQYLNVALEQFGRQAEVIFAQHHWPIWGNDQVVDYLAKQRDIYKHLHDQTLKLANQGYTAPEIAELLTLPDDLAQEWSVRGLYGAVKHNVKAIYQRYLGWYDANPAHLDPLPPVAAARKWLEYAGGAAAILTRAKADFANGDYRWVAEVTSQVVQAEPQNREAVLLLAASFEQLAYQAESATWRNAYLQGAQELRDGVPEGTNSLLSHDLLQALDASNLFDALATRLNSQRANGVRLAINWHFTDINRDHLLSIEHATLNHLPGHASTTADLSVRLSQTTLRRILFKQLTAAQALGEGLLVIQGAAHRFAELFTLFDELRPHFPIVTPRVWG